MTSCMKVSPMAMRFLTASGVRTRRSSGKLGRVRRRISTDLATAGPAKGRTTSRSTSESCVAVRAACEPNRTIRCGLNSRTILRLRLLISLILIMRKHHRSALDSLHALEFNHQVAPRCSDRTKRALRLFKVQNPRAAPAHHNFLILHAPVEFLGGNADAAFAA